MIMASASLRPKAWATLLCVTQIRSYYISFCACTRYGLASSPGRCRVTGVRMRALSACTRDGVNTVLYSIAPCSPHHGESECLITFTCTLKPGKAERCMHLDLDPDLQQWN